MTLLDDLRALLGPTHVLTGPDLAKYTGDWSGHYHPNPMAVARPADTAEVAAVLQCAARHKTPVIPVSGLTGLVGGAMTNGGLMLSVERLNKIREIRPSTRIAIVEAGVVLQALHDAAEAQGLYFPLWFGARGSAMIGGVLSTNAGGSNVVRYGSTRALCLGLEVVLPDGRILNLMSELHKDNSGYDLKDLFIGAEGTLAYTRSLTLKLAELPRAKVLGILRDALRQKSMGIIEEIPEKGIVKYAKPAGVICSLIPVTSPYITPIGIAIYAIICIPLCFILIGFPMLFAVGIASLILTIIGLIRATEGKIYRFPLTIRML